MPLEIIPHVLILSDVDKDGDVCIISHSSGLISPSTVIINKEQAEKIISHLQEQFKLKP